MAKRFALLVLLFSPLCTIPCVAQIMDFEPVADTDECPTGGNGFTQNGILLSDNTAFDPQTTEYDSCTFGVNNTMVTPTNGSDIFGWCGSCNTQPVTLSIQRQDATPFRLQSIDFSRFPGGDNGSITIRGYPASGGSPVTLQHTIDSDAWETVLFDSSFDNLQRVEIVNNAYPDEDRLLDNIVLAAPGMAQGPDSVPVMGPIAYLLLSTTVLLAALRGLRYA